MDKSPFHSPSPQDSPRLSSFTQHHRPVIAVHSGEHVGPRQGGAAGPSDRAPPSLGRGSPSGHLTVSPGAIASRLGHSTQRCRGAERLALIQALGPQFPPPSRKEVQSGLARPPAPLSSHSTPTGLGGHRRRQTLPTHGWTHTRTRRPYRGAPGHRDRRPHARQRETDLSNHRARAELVTVHLALLCSSVHGGS